MRRFQAWVFVALGVGLLLAPASALASAGAKQAAIGTRHPASAGFDFARLGDATTYAISGHVRDYGDNLVAGAEVDWGWWDANTGFNYGGTYNPPSGTDSSGAFSFPAVTSAPVAGNDYLDIFYNPTSPGLEELDSWALNFSANNDGSSSKYEMQPGQVDVTMANAPQPVAELKVGDPDVGYAWSDVDLTQATPVASVLPPDFDDVLAYFYGPIGNCTAQVESLVSSPVDVAAGTTAAGTVALDWNSAQYAYLNGPTCQHSGKPGTKVKMVLKGWTAGQQAQFTSSYGSGSSDDGTVTSSGIGTFQVPLKINTNAPVGLCEIDTNRVDTASYVNMWDYFQVCTFKASATVIHHGKTVRLSGKVPGSGKVTIYARTKAAGQPTSLAAKGWAKVGTCKIKSGKFASGLLHPRRTTWYVAKYTGLFPAFTSVVKVTVH